MVAKSDILTARREIEKELWEFVHDRTCDLVHVFESDWGHLRAVVASDAFKDVSVVERQELVWKWLREHVASEYLVLLYGVHPLDHAEYDASVKRD